MEVLVDQELKSRGYGYSTITQLKKQNCMAAYLHRVFDHLKTSGIGRPSVYHALVVIFLEFFTWGLLTMPVVKVLNKTFPHHSFLVNGLMMGIKGFLSFLSAPIIGAVSDVWGRKLLLLLTVLFTCAPIPIMTINTWCFFATISISSIFTATHSVVLAYVADVTTTNDRYHAYGMVSATIATSLAISTGLGTYLCEVYGDTIIVVLATAIALLDVLFIFTGVPESLRGNIESTSRDGSFTALRNAGLDRKVLMQCITVLLSYLPAVGQYSCLFVYLKLKMGFSSVEVSFYIIIIDILSILTQLSLGFLIRMLGTKRTIILSLVFEMVQLLLYGFGTRMWMMWAAGILQSLGSITYPAISAFVSIHSNADTQGVCQGLVAGMRGLCNGLGPAMFGIIFYLFRDDLNDQQNIEINNSLRKNEIINSMEHHTPLIPGPPFVVGAFMVFIAILLTVFNLQESSYPTQQPSGSSLGMQYDTERNEVVSQLSPIME